MAGITPAGWQNHIQNPLAAVMYAVMNGAFDNARDARRTDYQIGQDRQRQTDQDEELAARASAAGVDPTGLDRAGITAAMAKLMQQRDQRSMADAAGERAANQAHRNQIADLAAKRERREAANDAAARPFRFANSIGDALRSISGGKARPAQSRAPWKFSFTDRGEHKFNEETGEALSWDPKSRTWVTLGGDQSAAPGAGAGATVAPPANGAEARVREFDRARGATH
jgi:hypothetical protein